MTYSQDKTCVDCGHEACEACVTWCDQMVWNIYCPQCDEVVAPFKDQGMNTPMACPHCSHNWPLDPVTTDGKGDLSIDPCCDGECRYPHDTE